MTDILQNHKINILDKIVSCSWILSMLLKVMNKIICNDKLQCHNAFHSNWSKVRSQFKYIIFSWIGISATNIVNLMSTRSELCDMLLYMTHSGYVEAITSKLCNCHIEFINRYGLRMLQQTFLTLPYFIGVRISLSYIPMVLL